MVNKTVVVCEFTDKDKILLNTPLPKDPCYCCRLKESGECYGCYNLMRYLVKIQPYKDAGIYEIAKNIEKIKSINEEIRRLEKQLNEANEAIPAGIRAFIKPELFE